jgi:hypothetical protein
MPRAFDITPSAPKVKMNSGETAEIAFTVSNKLPRTIRTRAHVRPDGETDGSWLHIPPDGAEPELNVDETKLITVKVELPAKLKDGTYPFHIVVSSLAEPDEVYAESATVPIIVKHVEQRFPWWIVILAAGVLVIGGGAFGLAKVMGGKKKVAVGTNCTANANCGDNQRCVEFRPGAKACLLEPEQACAGDALCSSGYCRAKDHKCSRDDGACTAATAALDCRPGVFVCANNKCLLTVGQRCTQPAECAVGFCIGGVCQPCVFCGQLPTLAKEPLKSYQLYRGVPGSN